jgi:hypothetical protein
MIYRFAESRLVVMATDTLAIDFLVVHTFERYEASRGMTGVAMLRGLDMSSDLGRRCDDSAIGVTVLTLT